MTPPNSVTIDANVFVAAARQVEPHYTQSRLFLITIRRQGISAICPTLLLAEMTAAIARRTGDSVLAGAVLARVRALRNLAVVSLDEPVALAAADLAAAHFLRGADAVYLAVAQQHDATLITWDAEMLQRGPAVLPTLTPTDWLLQAVQEQGQ